VVVIKASSRKSAVKVEGRKGSGRPKRNCDAVDWGNALRLRQQLAVTKHRHKFANASTITEKRRLLNEIAYYPQHDKRRETKKYKRVHDDLTVTKDLPCLLCGVRNSTLTDPTQNRYGAHYMETHHHVIEWALAKAIDVGKFNKAMRPNLAHRHPQEYLYSRDMTAKEVTDWVDHSPDNLWVLCDVHHRSKYFGIHEITFPIWGPMDLLKPKFDEYVRKRLRQTAAAEKTRKPKARPD
jgi:hypothetical protein